MTALPERARGWQHFVERARRKLEGPHVPRLVAGIVALLLVPSLFLGLSADDYSHWLRAGGQMPYGSRFDVFDFCDGSPNTLAFLRDAGIVSWWGLPGVRLRFFRPLSSLWHWVDYTLWPGAPWIMHAESAAVCALLAAAAAVLYRRIVGPTWVAGLAAVIYAVDPGHGFVGWIAFRNAVLSTVLGVLSLVAHDRARRDGYRPGLLIGPVLFALALAAGEAALATLAYVLAYALCIDLGSATRRALSVVPYVAVAGAWQIAYRTFGFGARGSGLYFDPGAEPLRYLRQAPEHAVSLLLGQFAEPPADVVLALSPSAQLVLFGAGVLLLAWLAWLVWPLVRADRSVRFFTVGALLSVPPICATFPSNRLLFFVSLGGAGLVAKMTEALAGSVWEGARRAAARLYVMAWMVLHVALGPLLFVASSCTFWALDAYIQSGARGLPKPEELSGRRVIVIDGPDLIFPLYRFVVPRDGVLQHGVRGLLVAVTTAQVLFERKGPATFRATAADDLASTPTASLFRADGYPLTPGEVFHAGKAVVRVDGVAENGHAKVATFDLGSNLDDPGYVWLAWDHGRYVPFTVPPIGGTATVGGD